MGDGREIEAALDRCVEIGGPPTVPRGQESRAGDTGSGRYGWEPLSLKASLLLFGGVGDLHSAILGGEGLAGSFSCVWPYPTVTRLLASIPNFSDRNCFTASARRSDRP